CTRDHSGFDYW
nr:immunoglobulin heavy chain junction region [Macaca mulatta]MOW79259.1 immunoglobulin heavy chain junction region [Macaca mulatta]MOW80085.1 immunoglobulin heavy chain junction region [Macaca mulatta]MOW80816.1 immunoglobulin heavy chain junction region [Macaca mulatta]MOW81420.1 immunoglobulin heavy chain junction region [Macaca mulatta]